MQGNLISVIIAMIVTLFFGPSLPGPDIGRSISEPSVSYSSQKAHRGQMVLGYFVDGTGSSSSLSSMVRNYKGITDIGGFWYTFNTQGDLIGKVNTAAVRRAESLGIGVYPLIHNVSKGGFNKALAHAVLSDNRSRSRFITGLSALAWTNGYQGLIMDIENVYPSDRDDFQIFLSQLKSALGPEKKLIVAVPAKNQDTYRDSWTGAFDYRKLGGIVDYLALMTYDEHSAGSVPGPVASQSWTESVVRYTISRVPPKKVLLGLAGYGYHWVGGRSVGALTHGAITRIAQTNGTYPQWSDRYQSPYLSYKDYRGQAHVIWYESSSSLSCKLGLVNRYGLNGVALWRLGQEDQGFWSRIEERLNIG